MIEQAVVAVVVPAHNEERWLGEVIDTMPSFVDRIIVVDDGSRDDTAGVVARRKADPALGRRLTLLTHRRRQGVGAAIVHGYREAGRQGAVAIAVMAGDGQMHPADLRALLHPIVAGLAEYTKGNRLRHPTVAQVMPRARRLGSWLLSMLTSAAAGVPVRDSQCGFTAISRRALHRIDLDELWRGFGYPNDLIGALARAGARIQEIEVRPVYRGEHSGLRPWHAFTIGFVIARVAWRRVTARRSPPQVAVTGA